MSSKVVGLGTAAMDVVLRCNTLPKSDGFAFVHEECLTPGGSCANVLTALSFLGVHTALVAKIGDDSYGRLFLEDLKKCGVGADHVKVVAGGITLHTFIAVSPDGSRIVLANLGNTLLSLAADEVGPHMLEDARVFYTDMFPGKPALSLAQRCRDLGIPMVFNLQCPPSFMALCGVPKRELAQMVTLSTLVISNAESLRELTGIDDIFRALEEVKRWGQPPEGVICTLGSEGAAWLYEKQVLKKDAFPVKAVDTTGAGDAFAAGLIFALFYKGQSVDEALAFANACAAIKCTQSGPRLRVTERDVLEFLKGFPY